MVGSNENGINANLVEALKYLGSLVLPKRYNSSFYTSPPSFPPLDLQLNMLKASITKETLIEEVTIH